MNGQDAEIDMELELSQSDARGAQVLRVNAACMLVQEGTAPVPMDCDELVGTAKTSSGSSEFCRVVDQKSSLLAEKDPVRTRAECLSKLDGLTFSSGGIRVWCSPRCCKTGLRVCLLEQDDLASVPVLGRPSWYMAA